MKEKNKPKTLQEICVAYKFVTKYLVRKYLVCYEKKSKASKGVIQVWNVKRMFLLSKANLKRFVELN